MPTATLTSKGQITIPKAVRERLGIDTGDRLSFVVHDDGSVVVRPIASDVRELGGLLHRPGRRARSVPGMDRAVGQRMRSKFGRHR
jgi:antitoxin PrlF